LIEWDTHKACGFIETTPPGKRYFAHKYEFSVEFADGMEPPLGTAVSFIPGVDARSGKERAQEIRVENQITEPSRLHGALKEWHGERGWGFIEVTELSAHGKKFFAHKVDFVVPFADGQAPALGTALTFRAGFDRKSGKERALEIQVEGGGPGPMNPLGLLDSYPVDRAFDGEPAWKRRR